jgi:hypothetical protein
VTRDAAIDGWSGRARHRLDEPRLVESRLVESRLVESRLVESRLVGVETCRVQLSSRDLSSPDCDDALLRRVLRRRREALDATLSAAAL